MTTTSYHGLTANLERYAEYFGMQQSVIENIYEEYEAEVERFDTDMDFFTYMVEELSNCAFMVAALNGGNVVECLEAYDEAFSTLADTSDDEEG